MLIYFLTSKYLTNVFLKSNFKQEITTKHDFLSIALAALPNFFRSLHFLYCCCLVSKLFTNMKIILVGIVRQNTSQHLLGSVYFKRLSGENLPPLEMYRPYIGRCILSGENFFQNLLFFLTA